MISVIVPVLNAQAYVGEALDSILAQQIPALELLVVDGGSTDGSCEVVARVAGVQSIRQQQPGLAAARNEGLAQAGGDFVAFLDADDCWAPGKLALQMAFLAEHPSAMGVVGHFVRFAGGDPLPPGYRAEQMGRAEPGFTPGALLARRSAFVEAGNFDPALQIGCDSDWFLRARDLGLEIALLPQVVLHKRIHAANLSRHVARYRQELLAVTRQSLQRRGILGDLAAEGEHQP